MEYVLTTKNDFIVSQWSGGETTQVFISPLDARYKVGEFDVRISSATILLEYSEFSKLDGYDRKICTLDNPIEIKHNHNASKLLNQFEWHDFSGEDVTESFGKCTDFNVIYKRGLHIETYWLAQDKFCLNDDVNYILYFTKEVMIGLDSQVLTVPENSCLYVEQQTGLCDIKTLQPHTIIVVEYHK